MMLVSLRALTTVFGLLGPLTASNWQSPSRQSNPASSERFADLVRDSQRLMGVDFETEFEVVAFPAVAADSEAPLGEPVSQDRIRYLVVGDRMRIERRSAPSTGRAAVVQINVWSDGRWSHRIEGMPTAEFGGHPSSVDTFSQGYLFSLMDGRFPSGASLAGIVAEGRPRTVDHDASGCRFEFEPAFATGGSVIYKLEGASPDCSELRSLEIRILEGHPLVCTTSQRFEVTEWAVCDGIRVPQTAELRSWRATAPNPAGPSPAKQLVRYRRLNFRKVVVGSVSPSQFETALPVGTKVHDSRVPMSYEIGRDYLYLDGAMYQLPGPLLAPPQGSLADLVRSAKRSAVAPSRGADSSSAGSSGGLAVQATPVRWSFVAVLVALPALAVIGITCWLVRSRQRGIASRDPGGA